MSSHEHLPSNVWTPLSSSPELTELAQVAAETLDILDTDFGDMFSSRERRFAFDIDYPSHPDDDDEYLRERAQDFFASPFFNTLQHDNQVTAARALTAPDISWLAGYRDAGDGLWPAETPSFRASAGYLSRFVLSGMLGAELQQADKKLEVAAKWHEDNTLRRAVLVGAASLAAVKEDKPGGQYESSPSTFGTVVTQMDGDIHGDFYSIRQTYLSGLVRDSASGMSHQFAPVMDRSFIKTYHSEEPHITEALLTYLVEYKGEDPTLLGKRLLSRIAQKEHDNSVARWGAFGDFDTQDGDLNARMIRSMVRGERGRGAPRATLARIITAPAAERLELEAKDTGVLFHVPGTKAKTEYFIHDAEIEEYIATLVCMTGGRVTPRAHIPMIKALSDESI